MPNDSNWPRDLARVVSAHRTGDVVVTEVVQRRPPSEPIAPGALYDPDNTSLEVFPLHKLVARQMVGTLDERLTFETYEHSGPLPDIGGEFELRAWWLPHAMKAFRLPPEAWSREAYPDNGDDDHCLFTWEKISAHGEHCEGYRSEYGWITVEAYERFVLTDPYRLRSGSVPNDAV